MKKVIIVALFLVSINVWSIDIDSLSKEKSSDLSPYGELARMFNLGSKNTNLQRENKLKEIGGKVVKWTLPVYEVSLKDGKYLIRTTHKSLMGQDHNDPVDTRVYITARNVQEKKAIEALLTDSMVTFKGVIKADSSRTLEIEPAILVLDTPAADTEKTPTQPEQTIPEQTRQTEPTTTETEKSSQSSTTIEANNKKICFAVMYSGVRSNLLEIHCEFKGGMSKKLAQSFIDMKCVDFVSEEEIKVLGEKISNDLFNEHEKMGNQSFCKKHKKGYMDLFITQ